MTFGTTYVLLPSVYVLCTVHVNCIFHLNPSIYTVAPGLTHPQTEMSTRSISWGVMAAGVQG